MPRDIEFKDEKTEALFFKDLTEILNTNTFADQMREKTERKDLFKPSHIAYNYVEKFNKSEKTKDRFNELLGALDTIKTFETTLNITNKFEKTASKEDTIKGHDRTISKLMTVVNRQPSLREMFEEFKQITGASLGDDDMRMLNSVVQTMDNLSDRLDLERRNAEYNKIAQNELNALSSFGEIDNDIKSFAQQCDANKLDGTRLDESLKAEEKDLENLNTELANLENKENQNKHSEMYNECSNRVMALKDEGIELVNKSFEIKARSEELADLDNRMSVMNIEIQKAEKQYQEYAAEEEQAEKLMNALDAQIAEEESKAVSAVKGKNYLNSPEGKFVQNRINVMNQSIYENQVLKSSLTTFEAMNKGLPDYNLPPVDISESYRLYRSGDLDESMLSQDQRNGLESYFQTKRDILNINPDYGDDFKKFEDDPQNKIPGDFEKVIGTKIRESIADKQAYIDMAQKTDFTKYNEAIESIAKAQSNAKLIQGLKTERAFAAINLEEARKNKENLSSDLQNWKRLPQQILKDAFPKGDNITINDVRAAISAERNNLGKQMKEVQSKTKVNAEAFAAEKKNLNVLKEGLYAIKKTKLEAQIKVKQIRVETINKLKVKGNELKQKTQDANKKFAEYKKSADCTPTVPSPYKKITDRLTYIKDNFNKVQSFWSKGMSPECKKMYEQLGKTLDKLKDPNSTPSSVQDSLLKLTDLSQKYLDAKKAQNVPKAFASQQRYWRLAFAEEMVNMSKSSTYIIGEANKNPSIKTHEGFMKMDFEQAAKNPDAEFNKLVNKHANAIKEQQALAQQKDVKTTQNNGIQKQTRVAQNTGMRGPGGM